MVAAVEQGLGPIDVLINNAGVFPRVPFLEMTESDWDYVLDVNLKGACFCAQAVARAMVAAETSRRRHQSDLGRGIPQLAPRRALRREQGRRLVDDAGDGAGARPHRIRVNAIAPGLTDTAQPRYGSSEAELAEAARAIPLGRMARPEEIARAAVFLASDDAGFVTGQTLHVNGGSYFG